VSVWGRSSQSEIGTRKLKMGGILKTRRRLRSHLILGSHSHLALRLSVLSRTALTLNTTQCDTIVLGHFNWSLFVVFVNHGELKP
jgi:hypothetical protein